MFHFTDEPLLPLEAGEHEHERGQILVLLALAMVGLLVAAGLATDAGILFVRRGQLDRAVDAAALAGVTRLNSSTDAAQALQSANTRGQQLSPPPATTAFGALLNHITGGHIETVDAGPRSFQPMNINFGLFPPIEGSFKGKERKQAMALRALRDFDEWLKPTPLAAE